MTTSPRRFRAVRAAVCAGLVAGGLLLSAGPASANSFNVEIFGGSYSYNDGQDRFCVTADLGSNVSASLSPVTAGRGPSPRVLAQHGQRRCVSLATAFEDSQYRAVVIGAQEGASQRYTRTFFS